MKLFLILHGNESARKCHVTRISRKDLGHDVDDPRLGMQDAKVRALELVHLHRTRVLLQAEHRRHARCMRQRRDSLARLDQDGSFGRPHNLREGAGVGGADDLLPLNGGTQTHHDVCGVGSAESSNPMGARAFALIEVFGKLIQYPICSIESLRNDHITDDPHDLNAEHSITITISNRTTAMEATGHSHLHEENQTQSGTLYGL